MYVVHLVRLSTIYVHIYVCIGRETNTGRLRKYVYMPYLFVFQQAPSPPPPSCVDAIRQSYSGKIYLFFRETPTIPKYSNFANLMTDTRSSNKHWTQYNPDISPGIRDLYGLISGDGRTKLVVIYGMYESLQLEIVSHKVFNHCNNM